MKIIGYTLKDIQSWDDKSGTIPLSSDKMNVIIAPSETGKSVIVKILKEMCFSGNWGYTWNSFIRRGKSCGTAAFLMEDGSAVIYNIWRDRVRYIIMDNNPDVAPRVWDFNDPNHTEIPEEVANHLGLIVDRIGKTVINVLDKDMLTPLVTAPPELNARITATITAVPEMEKRREALQEWKTQLIESFKTVDRRLSAARTRYNDAPEVDILAHQLKLDRAERLLQFVEPLDALIGDIRPEHLPVEPKVVHCPNLDNWMECCSIIEEVSRELNDLIVLEEPAEVVFNKYMLHNIVEIHSDIDDLSMEINKFLTTVAPVKIELPVDAKIILNFMTDIKNYGEVLRELVTIKEPVGKITEPCKNVLDVISLQNSIYYLCTNYTDLLRTSMPVEPKNYKDAKLIIALQKFINQIPYAEFCDELRKISEVDSKIKNTHTELQKLREELRVCPTCDRPWI